MNPPRYSVIVPVYNRPEEADELLASLAVQTFRDFEVIVVDDGSTRRCDGIVDKYRDQLRIAYFFKPNSGPGPSRNYGFEQAHGAWFVMFDSDCILPPHYLAAVDEAMRDNGWDAWGGPDRAHERFTPLQRAMAYTMSSFLTTGGIRGNTIRIGAFQPRSFNMGMSRHAFDITGGFRFARYAEDIELSVRMRKHGLKAGLIPGAFVYHKRRETLGAFFRQVSNFGKGRVLVGRAHPAEIRPAHWFPALFLVSVLSLFPVALISIPLFKLGAGLLCLYFLAIACHAFSQTHSMTVTLLSIPAAFVQLAGYGWGFLKEFFRGSPGQGTTGKR